MHLQSRTASILVCAALGWTTQAAAQDPITYWNERALAAVHRTLRSDGGILPP